MNRPARFTGPRRLLPDAAMLHSNLDDPREPQPSRWWPVVLFLIGVATVAAYAVMWLLLLRCCAAHNQVIGA